MSVIRAKSGTEPGVHKVMANYTTGGYKFRTTIDWNGRIGLRISRSFMNSPKNQTHSSVTIKVHDVD